MLIKFFCGFVDGEFRSGDGVSPVGGSGCRARGPLDWAGAAAFPGSVSPPDRKLSGQLSGEIQHQSSQQQDVSRAFWG